MLGCRVFRVVGFKVLGFVVLESKKNTSPAHGFEHLKGYAGLVVGKLRITWLRARKPYLYLFGCVYIYVCVVCVYIYILYTDIRIYIYTHIYSIHK